MTTAFGFSTLWAGLVLFAIDPVRSALGGGFEGVFVLMLGCIATGIGAVAGGTGRIEPRWQIPTAAIGGLLTLGLGPEPLKLIDGLRDEIATRAMAR